MSACGAEVVKSGNISAELTQTKVVLDELPAQREEYSEFFGIAKPVFFTPGLYEGFIPQGLCCSPDNKTVIISGYYDDEAEASRLALIDNSTGELVSSVGFVDSGGEKIYGHFSGVACSENTVFVTFDSTAYYISLSELKNAETGSYIEFDGSFALNTKGSFANYENGVLWIGDFTEDSKDGKEQAEHIVTLPSGETLYAWCECFKLFDGKPDESRRNSDKTGYVPDSILVVPLQVQGITRLSDGRLIFSTSYGRKNDSKIIICEDVFQKDAFEIRNIDGFSVPVYCVSEDTVLKEYNAVPMSQGIDISEKGVFLLFESGADIYRNGGGKYPTDYVLELDIS